MVAQSFINLESGGEEADIIVNLNDTIIRLEADNAECKNEAIILDNKLKVEQRKSKVSCYIKTLTN